MVTRIKKFKKSKSLSSFTRKKDTSSRAIFFPIILGLMILATISFLIFSNLKINKKRVELNVRIENLKKGIKVLEREKQDLSAKIFQVGTEDYLEKEARERFNLKKPGEEVVVILSPEEGQEEKLGEQKSFWQRILEKLGI